MSYFIGGLSVKYSMQCKTSCHHGDDNTVKEITAAFSQKDVS
jgi:hypothetical protein